MTTTDIDAIRQREQAADSGPWRVVEEHGRDIADEAYHRLTVQTAVRYGESREIAEMVDPDHSWASKLSEENAEFIAHARTDVPALLAKVDELTEKIERRRLRLVEAENDLLDVRGILSPNGYPRRVPVDLVPTVAPAVRWLADRVDELTAALANVPPAWATFTADDMHGAGLETVAAEMDRDALASELAKVRAQLTAANRRADGLQNDLDSATKANTAWANQVADGREQAAADIERMDHDLGDDGWQWLQDKAENAGYPRDAVRRRRTRLDFTTATIEMAYQYGYRTAAKVARGEVAR